MRHALAALLLLPLAPAARAAVYEIDPAHSHVSFRIKHLVSRVTGRFATFSGTVNYEAGKPSSWGVDAKIDPASIDTGNSKRDGHLKSPDFFDVAKCPDMSFKSTKVEAQGEDKAKVTGELTMHCVTKPVTLDVEIGGVSSAMGGRAGFSATGKLNRKDFGIVWNKALDAGGMMLGDTVDLDIDVEAAAGGQAAAKAKKP